MESICASAHPSGRGSSIQYSVDPYFGALISVSWDRRVEACLIFTRTTKKPGRARPRPCRNFGVELVVVWICHLEYVNEALRSRHVNALAISVVIQIIRIYDGRQGDDHATRLRIEYSQTWRFTRTNEQPVIGLVEGHGEIER